MIGIYCIRNTLNNKRYIGKSTDVLTRTQMFHESYREDGDYRNQHLKNSIKKYGIENFVVEVLEECEESQLTEKEIFWIAHYESHDPNYGYNKTFGGDGGAPTEETLKVLKESHLGNKSWTGLHHTPEQKAKTAASCKKWHEEVGFTEEQRAKMSQPGEINGMFGMKYVYRLINNQIDRKVVPQDKLASFLIDNPEYQEGYGEGRKWVYLEDDSGNILDQVQTWNPEEYITRGYKYGMPNSGRKGKPRGPYKKKV